MASPVMEIVAILYRSTASHTAWPLNWGSSTRRHAPDQAAERAPLRGAVHQRREHEPDGGLGLAGDAGVISCSSSMRSPV